MVIPTQRVKPQDRYGARIISTIKNVQYSPWYHDDMMLNAVERSVSKVLREHGKQYKQIRRKLRDNDSGRCAIGVMLDYGDKQGYKTMDVDYATSWLLTKMNDDANYTFEQIADWFDHTPDIKPVVKEVEVPTNRRVF